ncbi:MAG: hypothetical protein ACI8T1_004026 [Verrucomicrobiales bacterium]
MSAATRQCKTVWELLGERGLRSHVVGWDCPSRRAGSGWVHGVEHVWLLEKRDRGPGAGRLAPSDAGDVLAGLAGRGHERTPDQFA